MPGRRPTTLSSPANAESAPFYRRRDAEWPTPGPCSWRREQGTVTPPALPGSSGLLPTRTLLEEPRGPRSCASQRFRVALGARQDKAAHGQRAPPLALTLTPSYIGTRGGRWGGALRFALRSALPGRQPPPLRPGSLGTSWGLPPPSGMTCISYPLPCSS